MTGKRSNMRGRMVIWCAECRMYFATTPDNFRWVCPTCGTYTSVMRCNRCGYEWRPRTSKVPDTCPKCASPYWDRQRVMSNGRGKRE